MASHPVNPKYKSGEETNTNDHDLTEEPQTSVSQRLDSDEGSATNSCSINESRQNTDDNTEDHEEREILQGSLNLGYDGETDRCADVPENIRVPEPTRGTNLNTSVPPDSDEGNKHLAPSPSESSVEEELSSGGDAEKMPRRQPTSLPEERVPLTPVELPASPICPANGVSLSHGNEAPVHNGSPASTLSSHGLFLGAETKYPSISGLDGDATNKSERQSPVPSELPEKIGLKRIEVECEETRLLDCHPDRDVSNLRTYMNLYKALTGPSTVGMPRVIRNGGLLTGLVGFLLIGFLNAHCNILMVQCGRRLGRRTGRTWYTYEEVIEGSLASYSDSPDWQKAARYGRQVALLMLILCQLGLMSFYYQIIATTVQKELELILGTPVEPLVLVELGVCLCVLPYSWLRNLRLQAWFSTLANILNVLSIALILQYAVQHLKPVSSVNLVPADPWTIPLFIGGAVFTVEGIAMILPIENRARNPKDYTGPFGMVALATTTNVVVNLATGFYGYLAFGNDVSGNILVSLPNMWLYRLVSIMYASMVFLTFNLQLYQPAEAIYAWLRQKNPSDFMLNHGNMATRTVLSILTFLFAALVPRVDLMMSVIGAFCACFLVFILPVISDLLLLNSEPGGISGFMWVKDILILLFGVMAFLTGTYTSVIDIFKALNLEK